MYLEFYGFREKPFNLTPDPRFVFLSKNHREAFAHLLYGIQNRVGFIALTGEVGTGKTTVLRALFNQLDPDRHRTALIFNPCLSPPELLQSINREFGIPNYPFSTSSLLDNLNMFLLQQNVDGRTVVLVIDEAQDLEPAVLEQIRLISNLETDREKLIQIILSGQPEFAQILKKKEMRQLSQRISVQYHLAPMDFQDTVDYVNHRIQVAGVRAGVIFSPSAMKRVYRFSRGLPRRTNVVCDRALLAGYAKNKTVLNSRTVSAGIRDMKKNMASEMRGRRFFFVPALVIVICLLTVGIYFLGYEKMRWFQSASKVQAKEEKAHTFPIPAEEKPLPSLSDELGRVSESESFRRAFNTLAEFWHTPPIAENDPMTSPSEMAKAALDRELRLCKFSGNVGALLRMGSPAMLEMTTPDKGEKRFLAVLGTVKDNLLVSLPAAGEKTVSFSEMEKFWSGQGFLLWKDPWNILDKVWPGSKGPAVRSLQKLLKDAGVYQRAPNGNYDGDTAEAIKQFQSDMGIQQDGIAGSQTLLLLYRSVDGFETPKLRVAPK